MVVDGKLKQQVEGFKKDVVTKQQVLDALSGQSFGNTSGFSGFFQGLAEQNVTGLWITNLNIRNGTTKKVVNDCNNAINADDLYSERTL